MLALKTLSRLRLLHGGGYEMLGMENVSPEKIDVHHAVSP
jgi:hypothetical protein